MNHAQLVKHIYEHNSDLLPKPCKIANVVNVYHRYLKAINLLQRNHHYEIHHQNLAVRIYLLCKYNPEVVANIINSDIYKIGE